jgi:hypothetical protein
MRLFNSLRLLVRTPEQDRALKLLLRCLTPEQREELLAERRFASEMCELLVEGRGRRILVQVRIRNDDTSYRRAALALYEREQFCVTWNLDMLDSYVRNSPWLCIHAGGFHWVDEPQALPWPDRMLAYKLAIEDGTIWKTAGLLPQRANS